MVMLSQSLDERYFDIEPQRGKLLSINDLCSLLGVSRSMIYKCMKGGEPPLPPPLKIGALSRWRLDDIVEWSGELKACQQEQTARH
ncbi:MAG: helix-turn-helix domain-containing protein [Oricola sp.]|jgi:predicted DNA-binding transcriptional regulator AlpA|nr:helix-turn-helix domain-containing protein [Oricola sp.]